MPWTSPMKRRTKISSINWSKLCYIASQTSPRSDRCAAGRGQHRSRNRLGCGCGGEAAARPGKPDACRHDAAAVAAKNSRWYLLIVRGKRLFRREAAATAPTDWQSVLRSAEDAVPPVDEVGCNPGVQQITCHLNRWSSFSSSLRVNSFCSTRQARCRLSISLASLSDNSKGSTLSMRRKSSATPSGVSGYRVPSPRKSSPSWASSTGTVCTTWTGVSSGQSTGSSS